MLAAAFSTESRILLTMDSSNGFSTLIFSKPEVFTQPESTSVPTSTFIGTGSPVTAEVSKRLSPSTTMPSNGILSPALTSSTSPGFASFAGITLTSSPVTKFTTSGLRSMASIIWLRLRSTATSSKNSPILKNSMTPTASGYSPMTNAPMVAILIKKFSSKGFPLNRFLTAVTTISPPNIRYATTKAIRYGNVYSSPPCILFTITAPNNTAAPARIQIRFFRFSVSGSSILFSSFFSTIRIPSSI